MGRVSDTARYDRIPITELPFNAVEFAVCKFLIDDGGVKSTTGDESENGRKVRLVGLIKHVAANYPICLTCSMCRYSEHREPARMEILQGFYCSTERCKHATLKTADPTLAAVDITKLPAHTSPSGEEKLIGEFS